MDFEALGKLTRDVSVLQKQQSVLMERLDKLKEKSDTVSEVVYQRILKDYQHKLDQLNMEISPLYDQLKLRRGELAEAIDAVEEELKAYMVEKEEISVRAELGEFTEKKAASKIATLEKDNEDKFDRLNKLKVEQEGVDTVLESEAAYTAEPTLIPEPVEDSKEQLSEAVPEDINGDVLVEAPSTLSEEVPPPPLNVPAGDVEKTILDLGEEVEQGSTVMFRPPILTILSGDQKGTEFRLKMGVTNIGSGSENDIVVDDPSIAEKHAQITFGPDGFTIYDYNTPGGILVNGQRISEHLVQSGDKIQIGDIKFHFEN